MGDVAMTVPVLVALTRQHPQVKITVLTRSFFKPIFLDIPNVEVFEADLKGRHKGFGGLFKLFNELKKYKFEGVADLHNVLRSNVLKLFFKLNGTKVVQIDKGRAEKKDLTRAKGKIFKPLKTSHQRYAEVFEKLGFPLTLSPENILGKRKLSEKINLLLGGGSQKWVGIAPFAAFEGKTYPLELMEKAIAMLEKNDSLKLVFFGGGKKEEALLENLSAKYPNTVSIVGKLTFEEELALISNLDAMVSMDSGNAHLAAMFGVKTITLWGVTHPYAGFYPFGQDKGLALLADRHQYPLIPTSVYGNKFPEGYENAMRSILPEDVVSLVQQALQLTHHHNQ